MFQIKSKIFLHQSFNKNRHRGAKLGNRMYGDSSEYSQSSREYLMNIQMVVLCSIDRRTTLVTTVHGTVGLIFLPC
jgi:hypothetical protein